MQFLVTYINLRFDIQLNIYAKKQFDFELLLVYIWESNYILIQGVVFN